MAYKNKLILGTNKDTFIAADDTGDIVFVNEKGSEAKLTENGLVVKPLGATDFSEVGAGATGSANPIVGSFEDIMQPSAKLIHPDGSETPLKSPYGLYGRGDTKINRAVSSGQDLFSPKYMIDWTSQLQEGSSRPSFASIEFNLPAIAWSVDSILEIDFKNAPCQVSIAEMDFYDPNYQSFAFFPLISSIVCKNSPIIFPGDSMGGISPHQPLSPVVVYFGDAAYKANLDVIINSGSILYPDLAYPSTENNLKITGLDWVENLVAAQALEINANNLKPEQDGAIFDFSKLEATRDTVVRATSYFDPYDPNSDPAAEPISFSVSAWNPNGIIGQTVTIYSISIPDFAFPYISKRVAMFSPARISVEQSEGANETTWLNFLQALEKTANAVGTGGPYGVQGTWAYNGYTPNPDIYSTNPADVLYYELVNRGVSFDIFGGVS